MEHRTSLLIPCYNESASIPQLCERLKALRQAFGTAGVLEVVFVDDGSTDGTSETIARSMNGFPHQVIRHPHNCGIGAAFRTGFQVAQGDEFVTIDSDCTYDPMQIPGILQILRSGYDVVTASPYHPQGQVVGVGGWRLLLSKTLSRAYWFVLPTKLFTYTSCFRAYRRKAVESIRIDHDGFLGVTEILAKLILGNARVAEMPARLTRRSFGRSKINMVKVALSHAWYLLVILRTRVLTRHTSTEK